MYSKYIILSVILFVGLQYGNAGLVRDPKLEERIEDMWTKVNEAQNELLDEFTNELRNDTDIEESVRDKIVGILEDIGNSSQKYYMGVEEEARKIGSLNYTSPVMYVVKGIVDHKDELADALKDLVRNAENMNDAMKQKFMDFIKKFVDWGMGCVDDVVTIQKTYPHEFDILEDAHDWDDHEDPVPSHYSPEVQAVGRRIKKVIKRCKEEYKEFEIELKMLANEWLFSAIGDALAEAANEFEAANELEAAKTPDADD